MTKSCETCKHSRIFTGFEQDPICTINAGVICNNEDFKAWEPRESRLILEQGGFDEYLKALFENMGTLHFTEKGKKKMNEVNSHV